MSVNLGAISGVIELKDDFTGPLGLAKAALSNFRKENQESLQAVAGAAGIAAAAITTIATATVALGNRGADVNDLRGTLEQFAGGARAANEAMEALRGGTLRTVDDFTLAKEASHLLSAGVKLNTEDFKTLGEAAFVLQNRGLGSTSEMLKLVGDAMITGRTKALAMAVGVVEVKDAEEAYAKSLGVTKDQLSESGKVEAKRIEIMRIMREAVKGAGEQQRDFGEQLEAAQTFVTNWIDKLGSAVAESKVFSAGMQAIGDAVSAAFGGNQEESINQVVSALEDGATFAVNFGLAAVETARVVHTAWAVIETTVLGVVTGFAKAAEGIAKLSGASADTQLQLKAMADSLAAQTEEAARGVTQTSEFDKTLDHLGGILYSVKDAMLAAKDATVENDEATTILENNAKMLAKTQAELDRSMIDSAAVTKELTKAQDELSAMYAANAAELIKQTGTSHDYQRAQIEATFKLEVSKLDETKPLYKEKYAALEEAARLALNAVGSGWDSVKDRSLEALRQQAIAARETYNQMQTSGLHFSREVLEDQRKKVEELEMAARGMGEAYTEAFNQAAVAAKAVADETERLRKEAEKAKAANLAMGGTFEITRANFEASARGLGADVGLVEALLKKGYSFQQAILWSKHPDWPPPENPGPRVPGFARGGVALRGGLAMVGEEGPELVNLPTGARVIPNDQLPRGIRESSSSGSPRMEFTFHVNGTAEETARKIKRQIMDELRRHRQFGIA